MDRILSRLVLLGAVVAGVAVAYRLEWMLDDSFISLAYARNVVRGDGLVFNVGEYVEGYTNFSWVVLSAAGMALGVDPLAWIHWLGLASFAACITGAYALARALNPSRHWPAALAASVVALYLPLAFWAASGMETALFAAMLVWSAALLVRGATVPAALLLVALSMTRPEGWLFSALAIGDAVLRDRKRGLVIATVYAGFMLPWMGWRIWYYGDWLPNTFRAKVGGGTNAIPRGLAYVEAFVRSPSGIAVLIAAVAGFVARARRVPALVAFVLLAVCYVVAVGGDAFQFHRFLVVLVPLAVALAPGRVLVAVLVAMLAVLPSSFSSAETTLAGLREVDTFVRNMGKRLAKVTNEGDAIAAIGIGAIKWESDRTVIDMLGLTDRAVSSRAVEGAGTGLAGHERSNTEHVLSRRPRFIAISKESGGHSRTPRAFLDMHAHPDFPRLYRYRGLLVGYERRDGVELADRSLHR